MKEAARSYRRGELFLGENENVESVVGVWNNDCGSAVKDRRPNMCEQHQRLKERWD